MCMYIYIEGFIVYLTYKSSNFITNSVSGCRIKEAWAAQEIHHGHGQKLRGSLDGNRSAKLLG